VFLLFIEPPGTKHLSQVSCIFLATRLDPAPRPDAAQIRRGRARSSAIQQL
jgi:hypothetical protein